MDNLLLVDAPNLMMRSVYAMRSGSSFSDQGAFTGPLVLFMKTFGKYVRRLSPKAVVCCWEGGKSKFRTEAFSDYKSERSDEIHPLRDISFDLIRLFLTLNCIPQMSVQDFEADDLIAAFWRQYRRDYHIWILSADKDLLQLVDDNCTQIRPGSEVPEWGVLEVEKEFGCSGERLSRLMAVMGDKGDSIPGIVGLGKKRGLKALEEHGWSLTENTHPGIVKNRDRVLMNYDLIGLREAEHLPDVSDKKIAFNPATPGSPLYPSVEAFLEEYSLNDLKELAERDALWHKPRLMRSRDE